MKYFISYEDFRYSERRAQTSFLVKPNRKRYLRLYNLNSWRTTYYRIIEKHPARYGWIVERKSPVDPYWKKCLIPLSK